MSGFSSSHWLIPKTLSEAVAAMEEHRGEALLYAGGTYVHEQRERSALLKIKAVLDLEGLGLRTIETTRDSIKAGAIVVLENGS